MKYRKYLELSLVVLLVVLMYQKSHFLNNLVEHPLAKLVLLSAVVAMAHCYGRNAGIISGLIAILLMHNMFEGMESGEGEGATGNVDGTDSDVDTDSDDSDDSDADVSGNVVDGSGNDAESDFYVSEPYDVPECSNEFVTVSSTKPAKEIYGDTNDDSEGKGEGEGKEEGKEEGDSETATSAVRETFGNRTDIEQSLCYPNNSNNITSGLSANPTLASNENNPLAMCSKTTAGYASFTN